MCILQTSDERMFGVRFELLGRTGRWFRFLVRRTALHCRLATSTHGTSWYVRMYVSIQYCNVLSCTVPRRYTRDVPGGTVLKVFLVNGTE